MISLDMKYTALYWALRFVENELDTHTKSYGGYTITIHAERQYADYGNGLKVATKSCGDLTRHKDFVILECVDRLLKKKVEPRAICINRNASTPDIVIGDDIAVFCEQWGKDCGAAAKEFSAAGYKYTVLYTSRLVSGLLEYKSIILYAGDKYNYGLFEDDADINRPSLFKAKEAAIVKTEDYGDFEIFDDELIAYNGKAKVVRVPDGITTIGASVFWNNTTAEEIILPASLKRIGGDAFYYCTSLRTLNIPEGVWIMGNNPFAGCPKLTTLKNASPFFVLENGVLYNREKTNLIHYTIAKPDKEFSVPDGVECIGKHAFFACNTLEKISIPATVIRLENNPFSGCEKLWLENRSPYYIVDGGVIYNKFLTTIIGVLDGAEFEEYIVPETVTLISRNSFWNCKKIKKVVITKNVTRIGYNPFAGCEILTLESRNPRYIIRNGLLLNSDGTELICCTNVTAKKGVKIPDEIRSINRGAFSGCKDLTHIEFNRVELIDKSAFTSCAQLSELIIPDTVKYIGEWAFSYCSGLKKISIGKDTFIDRNAFNECRAVVERRV